jgi:hypothetical protein
MSGRSARRKAAEAARSSGGSGGGGGAPHATSEPAAAAAEGPHVSDATYEAVLSAYNQASDAALRLPRRVSLSAAALARPHAPASEAQRALLARALASNARFKLAHDALHLANQLTCTTDPQTLVVGLRLRSICWSALSSLLNSDEWRAAADPRGEPGAEPPRAAAVGECTFCRGAPAHVLLTHADGDCCCGCLTPTTRAYLRRDADAPVPLCCADCPSAPWAFEDEEDERGRLVRRGEVTERSYAACDCCLVREPEEVFVRRVPACAHCDAVLHDAARRKRCSACLRAYYCGRDCQKAHWPAHKAACAASSRAPAS